MFLCRQRWSLKDEGKEKCVKRCTKCLLPATYPGVGLDEGRVCSYCLGTRHFGVQGDPEIRARMARKQQLREDFEKTVRARRGQGEYDCLVPLSGGKDSSYLAYLLKEKYGLKILTVTVDTGLMSPLAGPNVARVVSRLNVEHVFVTPKADFFKKLYRHFLMHPRLAKDGYEEIGHLSTVCRVCCQAIHSIVMQEAARRDIPLVALAYSPDQIEYHFYEASRAEIYEKAWAPTALHEPPFDEDDRRYFWDPAAFSRCTRLPRLLLPFHVIDYPGADEVTRRVVELGLLEKRKSSLFVTNCRLNWLMIYLDERTLGYSPYIAAFSHQVRAGHISRRKWLWLMELERIAARLGLWGRFWKRRDMREVLAYLDLRLEDFSACQDARD
jgi:hypothetical protein